MMLMKKYNIVVDTDPGSDDALALAVASVYFKAELCALISSYGNVDGNKTHQNLVNLTNLLGIHTKVLKGSLNPLEKNSSTPTDFHGTDGLCGVALPQCVYMDSAEDSIACLYEIIKYYQKIKYVAVAPLTNLAKLIERFPDVEQYIDEVIIMGGGFKIANVSYNAEFNFSLDGKAVQKVLQSSLNKVLAPLDMTYKTAFSIEEIADIISSDRNSSDERTYAFLAMSQLLYRYFDTSIAHNEPGAIIHDATTFAYLLDPTKCSITEVSVVADYYGAIHASPTGSKIKIIETVNKQFLKELLKGTYKNLRG
jgi:inosine-uridine nucleoside N-ribohydrolase